MRVLLLLIVFLLLISCTHKQSTELLKIKPIDELQKVIPLSEFADSVSLIQLDNELILSSYGTTCLTDSFFIVSTPQGVMKYSYEGKLLRKIGGVGQGPNEYNTWKMIAVDTYNRHICVNSIPDKVLITYSYDGELLNRVYLDLPDDTNGISLSMSAFLNKYYFFYPSRCGFSDPYYWVKTDTCGKRLDVKQGHGYPVFKRGYGCGGGCSSTTNSLLYYNLFNDTIFRLTENGVETAYLWDQGKFRVSAFAEEKSDEMMYFTTFAETQRFLFFKWIDAKFKFDFSFGLFDKKEQRFKGTKILLDDLYTHVNIPLEWEFTCAQKDNKDYMIGKIEPFDLPEEILQREGIDPEGNLVMVLMRLKDK